MVWQTAGANLKGVERNRHASRVWKGEAVLDLFYIMIMTAPLFQEALLFCLYIDP